MKKSHLVFLLLLIFTARLISYAQDSSQLFKWNISSKKLANNSYELIFSTPGNPQWNLYAPNQDLSGVASASLTLNDSAFHMIEQFKQAGTVKEQGSKIFTGINEKFYNGATTWTQQIKIDGVVPGSI